MKTAVEWLQAEIDNKDMGEIPMWIYEFIEQAKAVKAKFLAGQGYNIIDYCELKDPKKTSY